MGNGTSNAINYYNTLQSSAGSVIKVQRLITNKEASKHAEGCREHYGREDLWHSLCA